MKKILPIEKNPLMRAYHGPAFSFGIVEANTSYLPRLLCTQFINCVYTKNSRIQYYVFDYDLWFDELGLMENVLYQVFPKETSVNLREKLKEIRARLSDGYYIYGNLNQRYLSAAEEAERDFEHDYLLYGFDDEREVFLSIGYWKGIYRDFEISYEEFYQATLHSMHDHIDIRFFRIHHNFQMPPLDCNLIVIRLRDYLNSVIPEFKNSEPLKNGTLKCGLAVWEQLANDILQMANEDHFLETRYIRCFSEHKAAMQKRVEYLTSQHLLPDSSLSQAFQKCYTPTASVLPLSVKYNMTQNEALIAKISDIILQTSQAEKQLLPQLCRALV